MSVDMTQTFACFVTLLAIFVSKRKWCAYGWCYLAGFCQILFNSTGGHKRSFGGQIQTIYLGMKELLGIAAKGYKETLHEDPDKTKYEQSADKLCRTRGEKTAQTLYRGRRGLAKIEKRRQNPEESTRTKHIEASLLQPFFPTCKLGKYMYLTKNYIYVYIQSTESFCSFVENGIQLWQKHQVQQIAGPILLNQCKRRRRQDCSKTAKLWTETKKNWSPFCSSKKIGWIGVDWPSSGSSEAWTRHLKFKTNQKW